MTAFKRIWDKMGKETTTTFTVTVVHSGDQRDFEELFKKRGRVESWQAKTETSRTVKTKPKPKYTPEQKMGRMLIKEACELAGLKYANSAKNGDDWYKLSYNWSTIDGGKTRYDIESSGADIYIEFPSGVGSKGEIVVISAEAYRVWGIPARVPEKDKVFEQEICFADPDIVKQLSKVLEKYCKSK